MNTTQIAAQHTPGPWKYHAEDNIISGPNSPHLIDIQQRSLHVPAEVRAANGYLIAAAPDLLAALQALWDGGYLITFSGDEAELATKRAALEAIAKATWQKP